ncbi:hypothetical protein ACE3MS_08620 [Paenibacillus dendritiformis]|jgi:hypothetical protein|uniref:Uncharacterized protein n=2 Tax=Paenibacillaceae TaxID=186822 RepID=A0ABT8VFK0_9BACL|nr:MULTISPECIES: hypothetical protein [Paenibacillaceae]MBS5910725.1 hypothetical protein [Paenibacillus macerans]MDO3679750.1 hypothetical protein [Paenibacillus ehimensis]USG66471.1 hypothetical protein NDK47_03980 [Brevibacillus ruminantium]GBK61320.1 hypothetical protein PbDSM24746_13240 [Paenibacillus macerans]GBK67622.1 hypothetical protein PbJCM17693_13300 [Paenibacillus macerans]
MVYFTKGRRRQYERLMQEKPGFNRIEVLEDETEEPQTRNKKSREAGLSKRSRGTKEDRNFPGKEDGRWKK